MKKQSGSLGSFNCAIMGSTPLKTNVIMQFVNYIQQKAGKRLSAIKQTNDGKEQKVFSSFLSSNCQKKGKKLKKRFE